MRVWKRVPPYFVFWRIDKDYNVSDERCRISMLNGDSVFSLWDYMIMS